MKIRLEGWDEGLEKVSLTKLQIQYLGLSLVESKSNVDLLLDGNIVEIEAESECTAKSFVSEANKLGAKSRII